MPSFPLLLLLARAGVALACAGSVINCTDFGRVRLTDEFNLFEFGACTVTNGSQYFLPHPEQFDRYSYDNRPALCVDVYDPEEVITVRDVGDEYDPKNAPVTWQDETRVYVNVLEELGVVVTSAQLTVDPSPRVGALTSM